MHIACTTARLITETGAFDRAAILRAAWVLYRKWNWRNDPTMYAVRFPAALRAIWADARVQREEAHRTAVRRAEWAAATARRRAAEASEAGRALLAERTWLQYLDDWRHVAFRSREIDAALDRLVA
jgi:hypothetical protein